MTTEQGGKFVRLKGELRPPGKNHREQHRLVTAENVVPGDTLVGATSGSPYVVLGRAWTEDHRVALTVLAPSGATRTWIRSPDFALDKA